MDAENRKNITTLLTVTKLFARRRRSRRPALREILGYVQRGNLQCDGCGMTLQKDKIVLQSA
jgi:hypothetical protein